MKCPKCNQNPISLVRFIFKFNPITVFCKNCGAKLKAGRLIRRMFYGALLFGFTLGLSTGFFDFGFGVAFLVLVIVAIPAEFIAWNYGRYEVQESVEFTQ